MTSFTYELSICIASYKALDYLVRCLDAVYQHPPDVSFEIILVNDFSGDGTAEEIARRFPRIHYIENPGPVGIAKGFNMAFAQATGRYLVQLSADAIPLPGALQTLYAFMVGNPETGMAGGKVLNPDGTLQPCGRRFPTLGSVLKNKIRYHVVPLKDYYRMPYRDYDAIEEVDELPNTCLIISRLAYTRAGGLDEALRRYYDDIEWCLRIRKAGFKIYYVPTAQVVHYCYFYKYLAQDAARLILMGYFSELYVFKKHYPWWEFQVLRGAEIVEVLLRMMKWSVSLLFHREGRPALQERLRAGWQTIRTAVEM